MANIIIPGSEIQASTPAANVQLDANRLMGQYRGAQAMAGALENVGDVAMNIGQDMQRARNAKTVADASLRMSKAHETLIESFKNDPEHDTWEKRAREVSQQVKADVYSNNKVSPALRRQLDISLNGWANNLQITAKTAANVQRVNLAWGTSQTAINDAISNGHLDQARNVLNMAKQAKLVDPVIAAHMEAEFPKRVAVSQIETGAESNPYGTYKLLTQKQGDKFSNWTSLDPKTREQMTVQVRTRMYQYQADNALEVMGTNPSDKTLDAKLKSGELNERGVKQIKVQRDKTNYDNARAVAGELGDDINTYSPGDDKDGKLYHDLRTRIQALPDFMDSKRNTLLNRLNHNAKGESKDYGAEFASQMLKNGKFGPMKKNDAGELTKQPTEEAYAAYYSTLEKLDAERKKNPKITFEEERALLAKWTVGARLKAAHSSFSVQNYLTEPNANATDYSSAGH